MPNAAVQGAQDVGQVRCKVQVPTHVFLVPPAQLEVQVEAVSTANTMLSRVTRQILVGTRRFGCFLT